MESANKVQKLKLELEQLQPIVSQKFETKEELRDHILQHQDIFNKARKLYEQIEELERELMTPEEQKKEDELLRLMKKKRQGEL